MRIRMTIMLKMTAGTLLALLLCSLGWTVPAHAAGPEGAAFTQEQLEQTIDSAVHVRMQAAHIPGAAVVVTMGDAIVFSKGYGYADVERQIPVNPRQTVVRVGSLTKTMTATAVMQLKERGKLALEEDVNAYLTAFKIPSFGDRPVTMHHLLTHTAGLDEAVYQVTAASESRAISAGDYLRRYFDKQPPVRSPGTEYAYSNAGLGLAGYVVEQIAGSTLDEYMSHNLFQPLNMPSASFSVREGDPNMAKSYSYRDGSYAPIPYSYLNLPGAGAVGVVPEEWAHFMIALLNEGVYDGQRILERASVEEMQSRQFSEHPDVEGVGYGLYRERLKNGMLALWHTGDIDGFTARMQLVPERKLGIFVISNAAVPGTPLADEVIAAVAGLLPEAENPQPPMPAAAANLEQYERQYTLGLGPRHGWGKWLQWLGARNFKVRSNGDALEVAGAFPDGSGKVRTKTYAPVNDGLFRHQESGEYIVLHQQNGKWKLTFAHGITMEEQPPFFLRHSAQWVIYAGFALLWFALLVLGAIRYALRLFKRNRRNGSGAVMWIAAINAVFLVGQLLYGNSEMITMGYPLWYAWGFSSLPFLAAAIAVGLAIRSFRSRRSGKDEGRKIGGSLYAIALASLAQTGFLFYWNMLSVHYS